MVNNLQIIAYTPLMNLQFPANAFRIYEVMIPIATFDILGTTEIFPTLSDLFIDLPEDTAYTEKFFRLNITSKFFVINMGTLLAIFFVYCVLFVLYPFCLLLRNDA